MIALRSFRRTQFLLPDASILGIWSKVYAISQKWNSPLKQYVGNYTIWRYSSGLAGVYTLGVFPSFKQVLLENHYFHDKNMSQYQTLNKRLQTGEYVEKSMKGSLSLEAGSA